MYNLETLVYLAHICKHSNSGSVWYLNWANLMQCSSAQNFQSHQDWVLEKKKDAVNLLHQIPRGMDDYIQKLNETQDKGQQNVLTHSWWKGQKKTQSYKCLPSSKFCYSQWALLPLDKITAKGSPSLKIDLI